MRNGPLSSIRVIELAGLGPGPFSGMLLSDMGADVVRIARTTDRPNRFDILSRGRTVVSLDLKEPEDAARALDLMGAADVVLEGFRPGVMERLGLGPDIALARNPKLVYGRVTGWGQTGPYAALAGHDLNYIAISGALHVIGPREKPMPPLNLAGDFGGGGLYLTIGILAALTHARETGQGQVVDCAMSDGSASMMACTYGFLAAQKWRDERQSNFCDGGSHFYDTYRCGDGKFIAVAPIERKFYLELLDRLGISEPDFGDQWDAAQWPGMKDELTALFATRTRDQWCSMLAGSDVCVAPVLSLQEAPQDVHNRARQTFVDIDGVTQPAPAPRFSRTPGAVQPNSSGGVEDILKSWAT